MDKLLMYLNALTSLIFCAYLIKNLIPHRTNAAYDREKYDHIRSLRRVRLSPPVKGRPQKLTDIVGQTDAIRMLECTLCSRHPQSVLLCGPPGVGKTSAARLIFEKARASSITPFRRHAPFIEVDATCMRADERGMTDPLIGSVHDPIYQGAGDWGMRGWPEPREGAVTRAHGGVLFIDEIDKLPTVQLNRLLKVMEDGVVRLESSYYDPLTHPPAYIRSAFEKGMPADFRLIAATSAPPEALPRALRSRLIEIPFRELSAADKAAIARRAVPALDEASARLIGKRAPSGRDAHSLALLTQSAARANHRFRPGRADVEWVLSLTDRHSSIRKQSRHPA